MRIPIVIWYPTVSRRLEIVGKIGESVSEQNTAQVSNASTTYSANQLKALWSHSSTGWTSGVRVSLTLIRRRLMLCLFLLTRLQARIDEPVYPVW